MKKVLLIAILSSLTFVGACSKGGGASSATVASTDDYNKRGMELMGKMGDLFKETDCDKLAGNVESFIKDNSGAMDAMKAWEKEHKDDKKAFEKLADDKMKEMMGTVMSVAEKCKDNKAFNDAMKKMPE